MRKGVTLSYSIQLIMVFMVVEVFRLDYKYVRYNNAYETSIALHDISTEGLDISSILLNDSGLKVDHPLTTSITSYIQNHPESFIPCHANPRRYQYCQQHYQLSWDSKYRKFDLYTSISLLYLILRHMIIIRLTDSVNRLHYLNDTQTRWKGPISLSIYMKLSESIIVETTLLNIQRNDIRVVLYILDDTITPIKSDNCVYHAINNKSTLQCDHLNETIYPINTLRNLAINYIITTHYLNMDMDLWPSYNLYERMIAISPTILNTDRAAFVLPAFQFTNKMRGICQHNDKCFDILSPLLPRDKSSLKHCMKIQKCQIANGFHPTHRFIDAIWWTFNKSIQELSCKPFETMEPYTLLRRTESTPLYDINFINYGYNKVQFIDELFYRGYVFSVLTIGFGFDIPHKPSVYANMYEESWRIKKVINEDIYADFSERLNRLPNMRRQNVCNRTEALKQYTNGVD